MNLFVPPRQIDSKQLRVAWPLMLTLVAALAGCDRSRQPASTAPAGNPPSRALPPSFFAIGDDVYHAADRHVAEEKLLRLNGEPRWFFGFPRVVSRDEYESWEHRQGQQSRQETPQGEPAYQIPTTPPYPQSLAALPMHAQGATLRLDAARSDETVDELILTLTLTAGERAIQREIEHRRTNTLPFLFALVADDQPVSCGSRGGIEQGGANKFVELVPAETSQSWKVRVALDSLREVLPAGAREIAIVAVFSERQHFPYDADGPPPIGEIWSHEALATRPPQLTLRSNEARFKL